MVCPGFGTLAPALEAEAWAGLPYGLQTPRRAILEGIARTGKGSCRQGETGLPTRGFACSRGCAAES